MLSQKDLGLSNQLIETIHFFNQKGWSPATSTNYSHRLEIHPQHFFISKSGVDKSLFSTSDLIVINQEGQIHDDFQSPNLKSSAETEIHTYLYNKFPHINCVLHTHSLLGTVYSQKLLNEKEIIFTGLEIIKGIENHKTHETTLRLPIVRNSQEMKEILFELELQWNRLGEFFGFLIAGHGLYAWGKDLASAKRHIETFEFLLECYHLNRSL